MGSYTQNSDFPGILLIKVPWLLFILKDDFDEISKLSSQTCHALITMGIAICGCIVSFLYVPQYADVMIYQNILKITVIFLQFAFLDALALFMLCEMILAERR